MKAAAIQMVSTPDLQSNLATARSLLAEAADAGAELVALPEYFCMMGMNDTDKLKVAEQPGNGPIQDFLSRCASDHHLWIVGGTLPLVTAPGAALQTHAYNTSLVYGPDGRQAARYDKMHLFRFDNGIENFDEARVLKPGSHAVTFNLSARDGHSYRVGMSICYDLRFPELYRALRADILLVPSAFTYTTGLAHWDILLRARAIENLAYVMAPAQGGQHPNGRRTWGHSMIVDPWGEVLAQKNEGAGIVVAEINHQKLQAERLRLPALGHAKPGIAQAPA